LLGDTVYGGRARIPAGVDDTLRQLIQGFKRQALHAERLSFEHPRSREMVSFTAPLPDDFQHLLDALIKYD
jgi:23S rRNA pseudouridine1911/1915/1917 synthase